LTQDQYRAGDLVVTGGAEKLLELTSLQVAKLKPGVEFTMARSLFNI